MAAETTQGIVLSAVKYGDKGVVVNVLTRGNGRRAFMASVGGGKGKGGGAAMLTPLSLIEFVSTGVRRTAMQRMSQTRFRRPPIRMWTDPVRRSVAMFVAELMVKSVPEEVPDDELFEFADAAIGKLDDDIGGAYNFHLWFMMQLAAYLGIGPDMGRHGAKIFDMEAGTWESAMPVHPNILTMRDADLWEELQNTGVETLESVRMTRAERQRMIEAMSQYYRLHLPGFTGLKSQSILAMLN